MGICATDEDRRKEADPDDLRRVHAILEGVNPGYGDKYAKDFACYEYTCQKEFQAASIQDLAGVVSTPAARVIYQHFHPPLSDAQQDSITGAHVTEAHVPKLKLAAVNTHTDLLQEEGEQRRQRDADLDSTQQSPHSPHDGAKGVMYEKHNNGWFSTSSVSRSATQ